MLLRESLSEGSIFMSKRLLLMSTKVNYFAEDSIAASKELNECSGDQRRGGHERRQVRRRHRRSRLGRVCRFAAFRQVSFPAQTFWIGRRRMCVRLNIKNVKNS